MLFVDFQMILHFFMVWKTFFNSRSSRSVKKIWQIEFRHVSCSKIRFKFYLIRIAVKEKYFLNGFSSFNVMLGWCQFGEKKSFFLHSTLPVFKFTLWKKVLTVLKACTSTYRVHFSDWVFEFFSTFSSFSHLNFQQIFILLRGT